MSCGLTSLQRAEGLVGVCPRHSEAVQEWCLLRPCGQSQAELSGHESRLQVTSDTHPAPVSMVRGESLENWDGGQKSCSWPATALPLPGQSHPSQHRLRASVSLSLLPQASSGFLRSFSEGRSALSPWTVFLCHSSSPASLLQTQSSQWCCLPLSEDRHASPLCLWLSVTSSRPLHVKG